jgi:hypothetical protein
MVMMCLNTSCHIPSPNGSLIITINPEDKYEFDAAAMLFYIL